MSGPDHRAHAAGDPAHAIDPAHVEFDQGFWDERYRSRSALWSGEPNPHLVSEAFDLRPGHALDVGCGEGADAIWLAERGWRVTAVDISPVALERGAARALEVGADVTERIEWRHEDLTTWIPPGSSYDLVSAQYMHLPQEQRDPLYAGLAASVTVGGTLLIVGHDASDMQTTMPRPRMPELFFTAQEVAGALPPEAWTVTVSEARPRIAVDPEGRTVTIHDAVVRAQRRG